MHACAQRMVLLAGILAVALLLEGCKTGPKFTLPRYQRAPEKFTPIQLASTRKVYLSPITARLDRRNKKLLDSRFRVSAWLTDALEQELKAAGITPARTPFEVGPAAADAGSVISQRADPRENAVYVTGEVLWFGPVDTYSGFSSDPDTFQARVTVDVTVHSANGETRFAKRGFCNLLETTPSAVTRSRWLEKPETSQTATQMALRQIIADPAFRKALE